MRSNLEISIENNKIVMDYEEADIFEKILYQELIFTSKGIDWNNNPELNSVKFILHSISIDYTQLIEKADHLILSYVFDYDIDSLVDKFVEIFSKYLFVIHPYFAAKIDNSKYELTPALVLLRYQILYHLVKEYKDVPGFNIQHPERYIKIIMEPLRPYLHDYADTENAVKDFETLLEKDEIYNELTIIKETLDSLKSSLEIGIDKKSEKVFFNNNTFIELFKSNLPNKIQCRINACESSEAKKLFDVSLDIISVVSEYTKHNKESNTTFNDPKSYSDLLDTESANIYYFYTFDQLVYFYIRYIVEMNVDIKKCKNCGIIFEAEIKSNRYCKNCRTNSGYKKGYEKSLQNVPIKAAINKINKKIRDKRKDIIDPHQEKLFDKLIEIWKIEMGKILDKHTKEKNDDEKTASQLLSKSELVFNIFKKYKKSASSALDKAIADLKNIYSEK